MWVLFKAYTFPIGFSSRVSTWILSSGSLYVWFSLGSPDPDQDKALTEDLHAGQIWYHATLPKAEPSSSSNPMSHTPYTSLLLWVVLWHVTPFTKFHEYQASHFCVILRTIEQSRIRASPKGPAMAALLCWDLNSVTKLLLPLVSHMDKQPMLIFAEVINAIVNCKMLSQN